MDRRMLTTLVPLVVLLSVQTIEAAVRIEGIQNGETKRANVGDSPTFTCIGPSASNLEWVETSPLYGEIVMDGSSPKIISDLAIGGETKRVLTIEDTQVEDSNPYECRDANNHADSVSFILDVSAGNSDLPADWQEPRIQRDPSDATQMEIEAGKSFTLKCIGGTSTSELVFELDGTVVVDDTTNTLTVSGQPNSNLKILMMSHEPVAGHYTCRDQAFPGSADDSVEVVINNNPSVALEIVEPAGSTSKVQAGDRFSIRCQASRGTDLSWFFGDAELQDEVNGFFITMAEDVQTQLVTSTLTKEDSESSNSGSYSCVNKDDPDETDSLTVDVVMPGEASEEDSDDCILFCGVAGLVPSILVLVITAALSLGTNGRSLF